MGRYGVLALLAACDVLAMGTWFSATAVLGPLGQHFGIAPANRGWITSAVQLGFVAGALLSAGTAIADAVESRTLIRWGIVIAALSNAGVPLVHSAAAMLALRFLTGAGLAYVYPPSVRLLSAWFGRDRGLAVGVLVGALTIGSFSPHLLGIAGSSWPFVVYAASAVAAAALAAIAFVPPTEQRTLRFDVHAVGSVLRDRSVLLANAGYWGHMWELYAVWGWAPAFYAASLREAHLAVPAGAFVFGAFGVAGAAGCVAAGLLGDRFGRPAVASAAMAVSGTISFAIGWFYGGNPAWVTVLIVLWGVSVIADSAQFSAAVTELADPAHIGTALTLQMGVGFGITACSIWLTGALQAAAGWHVAFMPLAAGPLCGVTAMMILKRRLHRARVPVAIR